LANTLNDNPDQSYCTSQQQQITIHWLHQMKADQSFVAFITAKPYTGLLDTGHPHHTSVWNFTPINYTFAPIWLCTGFYFIYTLAQFAFYHNQYYHSLWDYCEHQLGITIKLIDTVANLQLLSHICLWSLPYTCIHLIMVESRHLRLCGIWFVSPNLYSWFM